MISPLPLLLSTLLLAASLPAQPLRLSEDDLSLPTLADIPREVIEKVDPSVVSIQHEHSGGTGFIISEDGYILTNGHVVRGDDREDPTRPARSITVVLHDDTKLSASVIGFSMDPDVALLKVSRDTPFSPVEFADSHNVFIGQRCFAVGTPIGLRRTFTSGILSNIERTDLGTETVVFQTDAAINPGNSGGPLFDRRGRVLGINTYAGRGTDNIGFTIPIHVARDMIADFKQHGRFVRSFVPLFFTGELYDELAQALDIDRGILITYVMENSSAWDAGLRQGDILVEVDGQPVSARTRADLLNFEWRQTVRPAGETTHLTLLRGRGEQREEIRLSAQLDALGPLPQFARHAGEIPEYRYAALGLGVKSMVMLHQIIHESPDIEGVLVKHVENNSTASRADIQEHDVLTHVNGHRVTSLREFQDVLESQLQQRFPAIELQFARRSLTMRTAIAPDYLMKNQRVALISPKDDHEYVDLIRRELLAMGADITMITPDGEPVTRDLLDRPLHADLALHSLDVEDVDILLFSGGPGARSFWDNQHALRVVADAFELNRHIAAAGPSALLPVLASPKPLQAKITIPRDDSAEVVSRGAQYTGSDVESDGLVHTTTGEERDIIRDFLTAVSRAAIRKPVVR